MSLQRNTKAAVTKIKSGVPELDLTGTSTNKNTGGIHTFLFSVFFFTSRFFFFSTPGTKIGDKGGESIANTLKTNTTLTKLTLGVTYQGACQYSGI